MIPTDGSPLSEDAVRQGMALEVPQRQYHGDHSVTTIPHVRVDPGMIIDTPQEFEQEREAVAAEILGVRGSRGEGLTR